MRHRLTLTLTITPTLTLTLTLTLTQVSACATGTHAIGEAMKYLQSGESEVMLAGGTEAAITELGFAGFASMRAMCITQNDSPQTASKPFDTERW